MIFKNRMKQALKEGKVVFGPMVSEIRSPGIALLFAQAGFDFFFIDMEHSSFTMETMSDMILAGRAASIPAIVRPSSRKSSIVMIVPQQGQVAEPRLTVPSLSSLALTFSIISNSTRYLS